MNEEIKVNKFRSHAVKYLIRDASICLVTTTREMFDEEIKIIKEYIEFFELNYDILTKITWTHKGVERTYEQVLENDYEVTEK